MSAAQQAIEILNEAARLNLSDPLLEGCVLTFPDYGQLVMTGDLHGNRRNFDKLRRFCALEHFRVRHVILHEIIHEEVESLVAKDKSYELLLDAARWKCEYPDQVHFLLSNHELSQIGKNEISKNGRIVTQAFEDSVREAFGEEGPEVLAAIAGLIRSYPLGGRTANRVFIAHSLPSPHDLPGFDSTVFSRWLTEDDLDDGGSAHAMVWGRYQTEQTIEALREMLDVDYFICGHQPQETGFEVVHDRLVILASEHSHGVFLTLDLNKPVTLDRLTSHIHPFAGVA